MKFLKPPKLIIGQHNFCHIRSIKTIHNGVVWNSLQSTHLQHLPQPISVPPYKSWTGICHLDICPWLNNLPHDMAFCYLSPVALKTSVHHAVCGGQWQWWLLHHVLQRMAWLDIPAPNPQLDNWLGIISSSLHL